MIIKYNRPNVHTVFLNVSDPEKLKAGTAGVISQGKRIRFMPGSNTVDDADWKELKKDAEIAAFVEAKVMEEVKPDAPEAAKGKDGQDSLAGFSDKKAKELVAATLDRDLLKSWLDKETRSPVKRALEDQIAKVEKGE